MVRAPMHEREPATSRRDPLDFAGWETPGLFDRDVARLTVRVSALLAAGASLSFVPVYVLIGPQAFITPNIVAALALVVIAVAPFRDWHAQLYAGLTVGLALLTIQLLLLGRVDTGSTVWFLVPPLAAMLVGARRAAIDCAVVAVTVVVGVVLARELGWPILGHVVLPRPDLVMALSVVGAIIITGAVADVALRARRALMADVEARTIDLAGALGEARAARAEAVAAAEAKDRFFANLTHEIRTPLNGIAGTTELLRHTDLSADQRPLLDALGASSANLVALVNAMLDHARLRAGHVSADPAPVEVRHAAATLELLFRAQALDKGLAFTVTVSDGMPAWVEIDAIKVRQILANLVANAIKFTARGSVAVTVARVAPDLSSPAPRLVLRVTDTGAGIAPELLDTIFEPFVQGDASISRTYGGTGLGLAIARQLATLLDGTLTVESRLGEGSVFTLAVPLRVVDAPPPAPAGPEPAATPAAGLRVLLAEDNEINRAVASRMLRRLDAHVLVAENGARAVEVAASEIVHLILMDLQMPGLDGIEAARIIRNFERSRGLPAVPIVAMTGNDPEDYGDACTAAGMDGFLMKPVDMARLREVLGRVAAGEPA